MIKNIRISLKPNRTIKEVVVRGVDSAKAILDDTGVDSAILVVRKNASNIPTVFIVYNSSEIQRKIGRRLPDENIERLLDTTHLLDLSSRYNIPTRTQQLSTTWQVLDGWWNEYFGDYACTHSFKYYLVSKESVKTTNKYIFARELYV